MNQTTPNRLAQHEQDKYKYSSLQCFGQIKQSALAAVSNNVHSATCVEKQLIRSGKRVREFIV